MSHLLMNGFVAMVDIATLCPRLIQSPSISPSPPTSLPAPDVRAYSLAPFIAHTLSLIVNTLGMQGFPDKHSVLVRSMAELDVRDPSLVDSSLVGSVPVVGSLASPLVGGGENGGVQPPSSPGHPPPGNPSSSPVSTSGSENGNGNGEGGGGGHSPSPTSGGGAVSQPETTVSTKASTPGNSPTTPKTNGGSSTTTPSSPGGGGSYAVSSGQPAAATDTTFTTSLGTSPSVLSAPSQYSLGSGSNTKAGVLAPSSTTAATALHGQQLSGGAIAGIFIACLFSLLALVLLLFRRHSIARRVELRNRWWFNRTHDGGFPSVGPMRTNGEVQENRLTARSSFATNFDQGLMFRVDSPTGFSPGVVPDYPPIAEVRERNSVLISTGGAAARRDSMNSMFSHSSDSNTQYLAVSTAQNQEPFTPMSVRPFSPSESFFFPKPPAPSSTDSFFLPGTQGHISRQSSAATLVQVSTPPRAFMVDLPPPSASMPSVHPQALTSGTAHTPVIAAVDTFPFTDPVTPAPTHVEVIRRPFLPSLEDELTVYPGDQIRFLQLFDDGWAFVEKLAGEGTRHARGLIPIDCLREADQPLPTFLAQKRISYGSDEVMGYAL